MSQGPVQCRDMSAVCVSISGTVSEHGPVQCQDMSGVCVSISGTVLEHGPVQCQNISALCVTVACSCLLVCDVARLWHCIAVHSLLITAVFCCSCNIDILCQ